MEDFLQDLKHSLRMFARTPGFTLTAVAAIALGIGANTAIFSLINRVLLRPMPYPDADRIVFFMNVSPGGSWQGASPAKFNFWKAQTASIQDAASWRFGVANYNPGDRPEQIQATQVTEGFFRLLGSSPLHGRTFTQDEDVPGAPYVVDLSYEFWQRRFGSDPSVVGKAMDLDGESYQIIGVLRPGLKIEIDQPPDVYLPFRIDPNSTEQGNYFNSGARLKAGVTLASAKAQFRVATEEFRRRYPTILDPNQTFGVDGLREVLVRDVRTLLLMLMGAVGLVLLIACANVANLLLARATGRKREIAIRAAVGAGRGRIIRQLLTESVVLSMTGGLLGLALGFVGIRAILVISAGNIPRIGAQPTEVSMDLTVVLFTLGLSFATGILFGLIPALQSSRPDLSGTLKESAGRGGSSFRHNKARSVLVVVEVALAMVLLIGAGLLLRTFTALRNVNPGFNPHNVLTLRMLLAGPHFQKTADVARLATLGTDRLKAVPGVESAAVTCCVPLEGGIGLPFRINGRPLAQGPYHGGGRYQISSPGYFDVFKVPLIRGRAFTAQDAFGAPPVMIINQAMARQYWKDGDPLGAQLFIGGGFGKFEDGTRQIVGIVGDERDNGLNSDPPSTMYIPQAQLPDHFNLAVEDLGPIAWVVRTKLEPRLLQRAIEKELMDASGGLALTPVRTMDEVVSRSTAETDFNTLVLSIFAGVALVLAAIGIYGLMAYSVEQRSQEIGIRLALGAGPGNVRNMVVLHGMQLAMAGVIIGAGSALALTKVIASFLYGVKAHDPLIFVAVPVVLSLVALFAVWLPAQRATRVSPVEALRSE